MGETATIYAPYSLQPNHVPADLVVELAPYNDGHWILTRRGPLVEAFGNYERFTLARDASVDKVHKESEPRLALIKADPLEGARAAGAGRSIDEAMLLAEGARRAPAAREQDGLARLNSATGTVTVRHETCPRHLCLVSI